MGMFIKPVNSGQHSDVGKQLMFELLDIRSSQIADNVKKGGGDLFYEQNKGSIMTFGDMMMGLAQVSVLCSENAVAPNPYWLDTTQTYTGNNLIPSTR